MWPFAPGYPERSAEDVAGKTYDYVIVGGGTAGCVVASRLSEDKNVSVLVIERGKVMDSLLNRSPLASQNWQDKSNQAVQYKSEPVKDCNDRALPMFVAEALGGSSRINGLVYTRGPPSEYNTWRDMGHPDWSYEKVLPYFMKSENCDIDSAGKHRGTSGIWSITRRKPPFKIYDYLIKAAESVGVPHTGDINSPDVQTAGIFPFDWAVDSQGQRSSTYRAFLSKEIALERKDRLAVCTGTETIRLESDSKGERITKVHFKPVGSNGSRSSFFVNVRREAIVCCGALRSPQLLMLSGIGPQEHLEDLSIKVARNIPGVGSNFADHYAVPVMMKVPQNESFHQLLNRPLVAIWNLLLWILFGTGLMGCSVNIYGLFGQTSRIDKDMRMKLVTKDQKNSADPKNIPDFEIMMFPTQATFDVLKGMSIFTFHTTLVNPKSRGSIQLNKEDPFGKPKINYNMLSDPEDRKTFRAAVRFAMNLVPEAKKQGYPHEFDMFFSPAGETGRRPEELADSEIDEWIRQRAVATYHFASTCRMAPLEDLGVVNDQLQVHGFKNLRVGDASIFPKIPVCHTMAPVVMVAERCADFIKKDWDAKS